MTKFEKRLKKSSGAGSNALVIGNAFGNLKSIINLYDTVFVISDEFPDVKAKNLVYRENFDNLSGITDVGSIFFDLTSIEKLEMMSHFWQRNKSNIIIEGNEPIGRKLSSPLYKTGWECVSTNGSFHVWKQIK